jgi:hypothetical protein
MKGNYAGSGSASFTVKAKKITPTVTLSNTKYIYNGKVKKPTVTVYDGETKLASKNYTVEYPEGRKYVGKYTVKVTLKGNYSGSKSASFTVVPKGCEITAVTPKSKAFTVKWDKQTTQTTGYELCYSTGSSFSSKYTTKLTVAKTSTTKTVKELKANKTYYVRIRTYKTVDGKNYYSAWSQVQTVTTKA